jgi:hypothetical protein
MSGHTRNEEQGSLASVKKHYPTNDDVLVAFSRRYGAQSSCLLAHGVVPQYGSVPFFFKFPRESVGL